MRKRVTPPRAAVQYKRADNVLGLFADDVTPRHVTCFVPLDYDTVALGDKFGNIVVLRLPADVSEDVDNPSGIRILWDTGVLNGAPNKVELICSYYVGEAVLSLRKAMLPGSTTETIVYRCVHACVRRPRLGGGGVMCVCMSRAQHHQRRHWRAAAAAKSR